MGGEGAAVNRILSGVVLAAQGIAWRRGVSAAILLVGILALTAAAAGPIYLQAGGESILQDTLHDAGRSTGLDLSQSSAIQPDPLPVLQQAVTNLLAGQPGAGLFGPPILGLEWSGSANPAVDIAYREGFCQQVRIVAGHCPSRAGEIAVSDGYFRDAQLRLGDVQPGPADPLTVVAVFQANELAPYWFGRSYFRSQFLDVKDRGHDTFFTPQATFAQFPAPVRVTSVVDMPLRPAAVRLADVSALTRLVDKLSTRLPTEAVEANVSTTLPSALSAAVASWHAMSVPVWLIIVQLLALGWLLLFLVVANAAEARGREIALAKLRGLGPASVIGFGMGEVMVLLLAAFPLGIVCAWAAVRTMAALVLAPGIPVTLPALSLLAAFGALAGGVAAATMASWRTLQRPVIEQLRQAEARPSPRSWVVDAVVFALLAAGVIELSLSGVLRGGRIDVVALLVPGLLALAVGLAGSRALPLLCRLGFRPTQGRIAPFLALREVARRPATLRTVLVVVSAFGLATFSVAAWTAARDNAHDVAWTRVGADRVLVVQPRSGQDLASIVDRIDPGGSQATVVDDYTDFSSGARQTLAVDPSRFARVAYWRSDFAAEPPSTLLARLHPPEPPPLFLRGDALSVTVSVQGLTGGSSQWDLVAVVRQAGGNELEVGLGQLVPGNVRDLMGTISACVSSQCDLRSVKLSPGTHGSTQVLGTLVVEALRVHSATGWQPLDASLTNGQNWASLNAGQYSPPDQVVATPAGLLYTFNTPAGFSPGITFQDTPNPLPAILAPGVPSSAGTAQVAGLDGGQITVQSVATAIALPGAADNGLIVDREYAERIAGNQAYTAEKQVWLSSQASADFVGRLQSAGVQVVSSRSATQLAASLSRQGPGLALLLFLAAAAAAATLATGGSLVATHLAARRRGYELAALRALGVRHGTLTAAILAEYALLLGGSAVLGLAAGLAAAVLALPSVPEFVELPAAPPLLYVIAPGPITILTLATLLLMAVGATISAALLATTARAERLREAEP